MYDSVTDDEIPPDATAIALYINGGRFTNWAARGRFKHANILSITISDGTDAECLDCEPGDAPAPEAGPWVRGQLAKGRYKPVLYSSRDEIPAVLASLAASGVKRSQIRIWSAHTGIGPHICGPVSCGANFTADGTQWTFTALGRNLDESLLEDHFFRAKPKPKKKLPPKPHPKVTAAALTGALVTGIQAVLHARHLAITPAEASGITTVAATIAGYFTPSKKKAA